MVRYGCSDSSIQETTFHPDTIAAKEKQLAQAFIKQLAMPNDVSPCPICGSIQEEILFEKWQQVYVICPQTWSLRLAVLPNTNDWQQYFFSSDLAQYRASTSYQDFVAKMRREGWLNLIDWIEGRIRRYLGMKRYSIADFGSRIIGWINELKSAAFVDNLQVLEPLPPLKESLEEQTVSIVCLMDVLQRVTSPSDFLERVISKLSPGGLLVASCRSGSGFDILTLRGSSESVFPLDHICLPSPQGMRKLLENAGLEVLELITPGLLDTSLVNKAKNNIPQDQHFQRYLMQQPQSVQERFQSFLQQNNLSSHLRVVARKPQL